MLKLLIIYRVFTDTVLKRLWEVRIKAVYHPILRWVFPLFSFSSVQVNTIQNIWSPID